LFGEHTRYLRLALYLYSMGKSMAIEIIPAALLAEDKWEDFVVFLRALPIDPSDKKYILIQWAKFVGVALTSDMVEAVLGDLDERVRG